jgi:hypothetical protein
MQISREEMRVLWSEQYGIQTIRWTYTTCLKRKICKRITYSEVPLESLGALVSKVATDLTVVADVKSM